MLAVEHVAEGIGANQRVLSVNLKLEASETTSGPAGWIAMCKGSNSGKQNIAKMLNDLLVPVFTADMHPDLLIEHKYEVAEVLDKICTVLLETT